METEEPSSWKALRRPYNIEGAAPPSSRLVADTYGKNVNSAKITETAFEETPQRLRELEKGWRARRRNLLGERNSLGREGINNPSRLVLKSGENILLETKDYAILGTRGDSVDIGSRVSGVRFTSGSEGRVLPSDFQHLDVRYQGRSNTPKPVDPKDSDLSMRHGMCTSVPSTSRPSRLNPPRLHPVSLVSLPSPPPTPPPRVSPLSKDNTQYGRVISSSRPLMKVSPPSSNPLNVTDNIVKRLSGITPSNGKRKSILAYPLPPTNGPVPLPSSRGGQSPHKSADTITIPPENARYELIISLNNGGKVVHVHRSGEELTITSTNSKPMTKKPEPFGRNDRSGDLRKLRLIDQNKWNKDDLRDWKLVSEIVESLKRSTPRARIYHPLGQLTISCSSPPDIQLTFVSPSDSDTASTSPHGGHRRQRRVRIKWSRSSYELRIDTCTFVEAISKLGRQALGGHLIDMKRESLPDVMGLGRRESFRTKRIIIVNPPSLRKAGVGLAPLREVEVQDDTLRCAEIWLGLSEGTVNEWSEVEREGLRRLWILRKEWEGRDWG